MKALPPTHSATDTEKFLPGPFVWRMNFTYSDWDRTHALRLTCTTECGKSFATHFRIDALEAHRMNSLAWMDRLHCMVRGMIRDLPSKLPHTLISEIRRCDALGSGAELCLVSLGVRTLAYGGIRVAETDLGPPKQKHFDRKNLYGKYEDAKSH